MGTDDLRDSVVFYGIDYNDWPITFGKFINHDKQLVTDYINIDCDCDVSTQASACSVGYCVTEEFIFPNHIKKKYFIEGVIEGEFTVACKDASSHVTDYRVSVWKTNDDKTYERLAVTYLNDDEWIVVNDDLTWDGVNSVGEEQVYHWRIDCWDAQLLNENDRIYIKIEIRGSNNDFYLMHDNDPDWTDVWIRIPFRL